MLGIVNNLCTNKIEVTPEERKKFLTPFVRLCYDPSSPFNIRGPKFFANLLFLAVNFQKRGHPDESLSMEDIDYEIQKLKRTMFDD